MNKELIRFYATIETSTLTQNVSNGTGRSYYEVRVKDLKTAYSPEQETALADGTASDMLMKADKYMKNRTRFGFRSYRGLAPKVLHIPNMYSQDDPIAIYDTENPLPTELAPGTPVCLTVAFDMFKGMLNPELKYIKAHGVNIFDANENVNAWHELVYLKGTVSRSELTSLQDYMKKDGSMCVPFYNLSISQPQLVLTNAQKDALQDSKTQTIFNSLEELMRSTSSLEEMSVRCYKTPKVIRYEDANSRQSDCQVYENKIPGEFKIGTPVRVGIDVKLDAKGRLSTLLTCVIVSGAEKVIFS